jgi:acetyltransferase-like isoleucine patch superfamily enzyme
MDISKSAAISDKAKLIRIINSKDIHIGMHTWIPANAFILVREHCFKLKTDIFIGQHNFININTIIRPGTKISDPIVVGRASIVKNDVAFHRNVVGNTAQVNSERITVND